MTGKSDGSQDGNGGQSTDVLDIDGNKFTADDIRALQAKATQAQQVAKLIGDAAGKYEFSPEDYVNQAEGSFAVMAKLIEQGIIDQRGEILQKPQGKESDNNLDPSLQELFNLDKGGDDPGKMAEGKTTEVIQRALSGIEEKISSQFEEKLSGLRRENSQLFRLMLERDIRDKYPDLEPKEISQVLGRAANDPKKRSVWEHAEEFKKEKTGFLEGLEKKFAEKYGVDIEEFKKRNKMKQQGADGGAGALFKGKKFSFRKGEDTVHPTEAAREYLDQALKE